MNPTRFWRIWTHAAGAMILIGVAAGMLVGS